MITKTVEIGFPWGSNFLGEVADFLRENGFHAQFLNTGSDDVQLAFSREPFDLSNWPDMQEYFQMTAEEREQLVWPESVSTLWEDWKHLFPEDQKRAAVLNKHGVSVQLVQKDGKTYTATLIKN